MDSFGDKLIIVTVHIGWILTVEREAEPSGIWLSVTILYKAPIAVARVIDSCFALIAV